MSEDNKKLTFVAGVIILTIGLAIITPKQDPWCLLLRTEAEIYKDRCDPRSDTVSCYMNKVAQNYIDLVCN